LKDSYRNLKVKETFSFEWNTKKNPNKNKSFIFKNLIQKKQFNNFAKILLFFFNQSIILLKSNQNGIETFFETINQKFHHKQLTFTGAF
jgi:hypothetical protein